MKEVSKEVCPRDDDGVMLGDMSVCGEKRPAWCIAKMMHEFDESDLKGVQDKATSFITKNALLRKRLRSLTD